MGQDGGYYIRIRTQKTQTEAVLPISNETVELCGEPCTGKVFKGLLRQHGQLSIEETDCRCRYQEAHHLPLLPPYICHIADSIRN